MTQILEVWADSGVTVERDRNLDEQAQYEADQEAAAIAEAAKQTAAEAAVIATVAAIEHAKSLGFTDDMIAVMYPNLQSESPIVP